MKQVILRVRSITIASDGVGALSALSLFIGTFRTLHNLEYLKVATIDPISQSPQFWSAIDAICGSKRVYDSLETVEFCFGSPRSTSDVDYVSREGLGEKLPSLVEHGMLKVSDPNVYVLNTPPFFVEFI